MEGASQNGGGGRDEAEGEEFSLTEPSGTEEWGGGGGGGVGSGK